MPTAVSLVTAPVLVHALGAEGYAIYALALAYAGAAAALGPGRGVVHLLAGAEGPQATAAVAGTGFAVAIAMGLATATVGALVAPALSSATLPSSGVDWPLRLAAASAVPAAVSGMALTMLQGLGRFDLLSRLGAGGAAVTSLGAATVAWLGYGPTGVMLWLLCVSSAMAGVGTLVVGHLSGGAPWHLSAGTARALLRFSAPVILSQVGVAAWVIAERAIVLRRLGPAATTAYVIVLLLGTYLQAAVASMAQVLAPTIRRARAPREAAEIYRSSTRVVMLVAAAGAATIAGAGHAFLTVWMGPTLADTARPALTPIAIAFFLNSVSTVAWFVNEGDGRPARNAWAAIVWVTIGMAVLWVAGYSIAGVGAARLAALSPTPIFVAWTEWRSGGRYRGGWGALFMWVALIGVGLAWGLQAALAHVAPGWVTLVAMVAAGLSLYGAAAWWSPVVSSEERARSMAWVAGLRRPRL